MNVHSYRAPTLFFGVSPFLDGYLTVATGFIVAHFFALDEPTLVLSLMASGYVVGALLGCGLVSTLADRFGRRPVAITLAAFMVLAALVPCLTSVTTVVIAAHTLLGFLLGADQPVSLAIVAESSSPDVRPKRLALLMLIWYVGALVAVGMAAAIPSDNVLTLYWVPVLLALLSLPIRLRMSESTQWQAARTSNRDPPQPTLRHVLRTHPRPFLFCAGMWLCQTVPVTVFLYYSPVIFSALADEGGVMIRIALLYTAFLLGALPMVFGLKPNPSKVLTGTFVAMAIGLLGLAFTKGSTVLLILFVIVYALGYGMQTTLDYIYPNILFPADIRATASGWIFAVARVGSALAAFTFPYLLHALGTEPVLIGGAAVAFLGIGWLFVLPKSER